MWRTWTWYRARLSLADAVCWAALTTVPRAVLYAGTKEEVEAETRRLASQAGSTGVILGADCTLPATVDVHRFQWVVDALNQPA